MHCLVKKTEKCNLCCKALEGNGTQSKHACMICDCVNDK